MIGTDVHRIPLGQVFPCIGGDIRDHRQRRRIATAGPLLGVVLEHHEVRARLVVAQDLQRGRQLPLKLCTSVVLRDTVVEEEAEDYTELLAAGVLQSE